VNTISTACPVSNVLYDSCLVASQQRSRWFHNWKRSHSLTNGLLSWGIGATSSFSTSSSGLSMSKLNFLKSSLSSLSPIASSSILRLSKSYSDKSANLLSSILYFFFWSSVISVYLMTGIDSNPNFFAPSSLPWPTRMILFSSTMTGALKPHSLIEFAILLIWSSECFLLLNS